MNQKELTNLLAAHAHKYYVLDAPILTDKAYDELYDQLVSMETSSGIVYTNSPTSKVQGIVVDKLPKVIHSKAMLSCDKTKDIADIIKFIKASPDKKVVVSQKLDGLTLVLTYNDGKLVRAVTRGSGEEGEDVTHNIGMFKNVPAVIPYDEDIEIRGEAIISWSDFNILNKDKTFANPRNLASGSIRRLNNEENIGCQLRYVSFDISNSPFEEKEKELQFLATAGFEVVEYSIFDDTTIIPFIEGYSPKQEYPIDGLIIEYNNILFGRSLGATGHHENRNIAFKFTDEIATTVFRGTVHNTCRDGLVSIIADFDPVEIDGTIVSRASLHNVDIFKSLKLGVGDKIEVIKANQIIPQVVKNLTRSGTHVLPTTCPSCKQPIVIELNVNTHVLWCHNKDCPAQLVQKLVHFCCKENMDIDGLADAQLTVFTNKGYIKTLADVYKLDRYKNEIPNIPGFGDRSYQKIWDGIQASKSTTLNKFLSSLGLYSIGTTASKLIAEHCEYDIDVFIKLLEDHYDFTIIPTFGDTINGSLHAWYNDKEEFNKAMELKELLIFNKPIKKTLVESIFTGKTFCITGSFAVGSREILKDKIETLGGHWVSGVSKKTDFLVCGENAGSKLQKANECNVKVIFEAELLPLLP